jgi:hypothetical protein
MSGRPLIKKLAKISPYRPALEAFVSAVFRLGQLSSVKDGANIYLGAC